jgi:hypothetical protein
MSGFMSKENMVSVCQEAFRELDGDPRLVELAESSDMALKKVVFDVMCDVARDEQLTALSQRDKNGVVLKMTGSLYRASVGTPAPASDAVPALPPSLQPSRETVLDRRDLEDKVAKLRGEDVHIQLPAATLEALPSRDAVYQEYVSLDGGDRDASLQPQRFQFTTDVEPLRTVSEVRVWSVILPLAPKDASSSCARVNVTHVWLWVDELTGTYSKNRADVAKRSLCKLLVKGCHEPRLGRGHMVLEPAMEECKTFDPPLASLSTFNVSLRRPDGALIDQTRDDFRLTHVYQGTDAAANWVLEMDQMWEDDAFTRGDILRISGVSTGSRELDGFLGRREGHVVLSQGFPVGSAYKTVIVRKPGRLNQVSGEYEADEAAHDHLAALSDGGVDGSVINMSMQVSVSLSVKCNTTARHFDPSVHARSAG